uniref:Uncharacterized protein n=1 Tax=Magallana gigas TaxID=29159 RepID=K1QW96_MAGGI
MLVRVNVNLCILHVQLLKKGVLKRARLGSMLSLPFPIGLTDPDFPGSSGMDCNETELPSYFPQIQPNVIMTAVVVILFASVKTFYDRVRHERARVSVVVLGAGPIGLTAALLALKTRRVSKLTIYETIDKIANLKKDYQIAIDRRSVSFLRKAGVDFDNLEGCWDNKCFYTRVGIYLEYMLTTLRRCNKNTVTKFSCKGLFASEKSKKETTHAGRAASFP